MATNLFNTVFENASTKEQVINAFSEALDALINAKAEAIKNLSTSKKPAKKTKATETKDTKSETTKKEAKAVKEQTENKELGVDAAVTKKSKNGITIIDLKPEVVKTLKLHYQERSEKAFWVYGDTKPILSFLKAHRGGFSKNQCIVNGEAVPAWSFAKKGHEEQIRKALGI